MAAKKQSTSPHFALCQQNEFQDSISDIAGSVCQEGYLFAVSSWDKTCRAFLVGQNQQVRGVAMTATQTPILCVTQTFDPVTFCFGTANGCIYSWNAQTNQPQQIGQHQEAVTEIKYIPAYNAIMTSSFDRTIQMIDVRSGSSSKIQTADKVMSFDCSELYVTYSLRHSVEVLDLKQNRNVSDQVLRNYKSVPTATPQKVVLFPNNKGIIYANDDGRATVVDFNNKDNSCSYAFKAHHKRLNPQSTKTTFFPISSLSFYNETVFMTAGSDGLVNIWDKLKKTSVHTLSPPAPNITITTAKYLCNGTVLAYALGYDWFEGVYGVQTYAQTLPIIKVVDEPLVKS